MDSGIDGGSRNSSCDIRRGRSRRSSVMVGWNEGSRGKGKMGDNCLLYLGDMSNVTQENMFHYVTQKKTRHRLNLSAFTLSQETMHWKQNGSVLIGTTKVSHTSSPSSLIAAFDFDGTLSIVKGSHVHAKDADDWKLFHPSIPERLRSLHKDGFQLVMFSNQQGIMDVKNSHRKMSFMGRIENFVAFAVPDLPLTVYAATRDDGCRKPCTGMWKLLEKDHAESSKQPIEKSRCFFVGDAAGRPAGHKAGARKDFSDSDYKFALNVGITFSTPEGFFLNGGVIKQYDGLLEFDPTRLKLAESGSAKYQFASLQTDEPELVLMVGSPACGKSTFAKRNFVAHGYVHVNQDELKTRERCLKKVEQALSEGKKVVVDNTNPSRDVRKLYILAAARVAKKIGRTKIPVRCILMLADGNVCLHNNMYRAYMLNKDSQDGMWMQQDNGKGTGKLPGIAFRGFASKFQEPMETEGITEVLKVAFTPTFDSEEQEKLWSMYWT